MDTLTNALDDAGYLPGSVDLDIAEPCWLYAGQVTERATGAIKMFTYRSVIARTDNPRGERLREFVANARPKASPQIVHDALMMFGQAELTIWEAR